MDSCQGQESRGSQIRHIEGACGSGWVRISDCSPVCCGLVPSHQPSLSPPLLLGSHSLRIVLLVSFHVRLALLSQMFVWGGQRPGSLLQHHTVLEGMVSSSQLTEPLLSNWKDSLLPETQATAGPQLSRQLWAGVHPFCSLNTYCVCSIVNSCTTGCSVPSQGCVC